MDHVTQPYNGRPYLADWVIGVVAIARIQTVPFGGLTVW